MDFPKTPNYSPVWSEEDLEIFQYNLNYMYGRDPDNPFYLVDMYVSDIEYNDISFCDGCDELLEEPFTGTYLIGDTWTSVTYDTVRWYDISGFDIYVNGEENTLGIKDYYGHDECSTDNLTIYVFNTFIEEDGAFSVVPIQCAGRLGCNVACGVVPNFESFTLAHEIGHVFGIDHPYDPNSFIMGPDTLMCQTGVIGGLDLVNLFSPLEMYMLEPESGFENIVAVVDDYNANASIREYQLIDENDY